MFIQHLRMPKLDEEETRKALPWEARGKLPIDPSQAILRHLIAGETYQDQEPKQEVILMAAAKDMVTNLLDAAARAKLDVIGMNVEPKAMIECFAQVYRRKTDAELTTCFVDIGLCASRAVIGRGKQIFFARNIPIGGEHFTRAAADALGVSFEEARLIRIKLCHAHPALDEHRERTTVAAANESSESVDHQFALLRGAASGDESSNTAVIEAPAPVSATASRQFEVVEEACQAPLAKLIEELNLCRRYYEATFPSAPVDRLMFLGGEARQRGLCQQIARELHLAAQVGDPLVRMGRLSDVGIESGIDRRQPQPAWAVAIGLSMGGAA